VGDHSVGDEWAMSGRLVEDSFIFKMFCKIKKYFIT
jgi:hypothetical protein